MDKKKIKRESAKATLADVTREMAKPRIAMSARGDIKVWKSRATTRTYR